MKCDIRATLNTYFALCA